MAAHPTTSPTPTPNILLIGLRGSGKSTIGRMLAARLSRPFVDLDDLTPQMLGETTVAAAFKKHGEPAFRTAEVGALIDCLKSTGQVIALGGGTPTAPDAADLLKSETSHGRARVVYLRAQPSTLRARLEKTDNAHRPSLTGKGVLDEIEDLFRSRDGLYRSLADLVIESGALDAGTAVAAISGW